MGEELLKIDDLSVYYISRESTSKAVNHVSLTINKGETLGLVGETGAGKTTIALSILRLLDSPPGKLVGGTIEYKGMDIYRLKKREMRQIRGFEISMIFQDPMTALNPVDTVGEQITEVIRLHRQCSRMEARKLAGDMMETVGIPRERYDEYPHQFSGGMIQRIVIAIALACSPELLLADEPTTALDVTIQAQVLDMMNDLKKKFGTSVLMITHDLGIIAEMCDRVAVIYAGEVVELGDLEAIFHHTAHPYTKGLFDSLPNAAGDSKRLQPIKGLMPDPANLPEGCKFCERCPYATQECESALPELREISPGHLVRCHHHSCFRKGEADHV
ncbi:ABC transporter ATP-binding protein [Clostridiales bacterium BX7]|uniref:Nickel import system ATP-binding protein NikD n=1 Tax=Feifania hominis TaxID=2763660 RepID=A0A926DCG2_9FIRM|nr:ABC transporter ATP-binding protein [Feifania hominis]